MITKLAIRNLTRNRSRTLLTIAGVAVGVAILVWLKGYLMGFHDEMIRGATAADLGQIQIASKAWIETPSSQNTFTTNGEMVQQVTGISGVTSASARVIAFGLVGDEERSAVARLVGVDPVDEANTTVVAQSVAEGRWLKPQPEPYPAPREVVVGQHLANQLKVKVGQELVAFFEAADGSLGNELLNVVGIVSSGSSAVDRQTVFINLKDLQVGAAMEGQVHQIAVRIENPNRADELKDVVTAAIDRPELQARSWAQVMPEIKSMVDLMKNSDIIMYVFVYILVAFGLFNAQRMSALKRRREFAMMVAIGVTPRQLFWSVMMETVLLALLGAVAGALMGAAFTYYFVVNGLDLGAFTSSGEMNLDMMGMTFSPILFFSLEPSYLLTPILVLVPFAVVCGLLPALQAARIDINRELNGRN